jgi:two-component system chemotaxis sensor kinase CheA
MDELVKDFLVESNENLDRLDKELVQLESDASSKELLSSIFRTIHTVKGSCGFLGFAKLEKVAHAGENLLSKLREGKLDLTSEITSGLLAMVDAIRSMLEAIQATEQDGDSEYRELVELLMRLQQVSAAPLPSSAAAAKLSPESPASTHPTAEAPAQKTQAASESRNANVNAPGKSETPKSVAAEVHADSRPASAPAETVRVDVTRLDKMMNLVGELVLARNQITQFAGRQTDAAFLTTAQQLNLLTSELQEEVTKTRMQPISNIFDKFPRVVRDIAMGCGKQVQVEMEGKETELDKSLLEAIKDPLTHIVRNSIDHGIERPEQRAAKGKRAEGRLTLRAWHEGGQVIIEISDDGAGIDSERIKNKALERGMITPQQAARMNEREALNLVFLAGLSTAEKVSNLSGRGVGMDVVKTNIEKVNGTVDVQSNAGRGTTIKLKIPLTLAIVPALIIRSGGMKFAIPQVNLLELVRLEAEVAGAGIELVHGAPVYRLRGRLLPLAYLNRELSLLSAEDPSISDGATNIVVLQADERHFGLIVDSIHDTEEIVVKPLSKQLRGIESYAGATIMGDGKVALILDVLGVAKRAGVISEVRNRALSEADTEIEQRDENLQTFILFAGPDNARMALPLEMLSRLEEFPASQIEKSGLDWVAQYRGQILPLIRLGLVLEERRRRPRHAGSVPASGSEPVQVLVLNHDGQSFGLVVENILDIVEDPADVKSPSTRAGIACAAVIGGRVTELLDIPAILQAEALHRTSQMDHAEVAN